MTEAPAAARQAAERIAELTGVARHDVAVVMGSGWGSAATALGTPAHDVAFTEIPGFVRSAVAGHAGRLLSVRVGDRHVLVFLGRTHLYEGRGTDAVAHGVRTGRRNRAGRAPAVERPLSGRSGPCGWFGRCHPVWWAVALALALAGPPSSPRSR